MQILIANGSLTSVSETLSPAVGYSLPSTVTVTGATSTYDGSTGELTLTSIVDDITVTASGVPQAPALTVSYDNTDIIELDADGTKTLSCGGKLMKSDVTVAANGVYSVTVGYDGNTVTTLTGTQTKTLSCAGKVMKSDVTVTLVKEQLTHTVEVANYVSGRTITVYDSQDLSGEPLGTVPGNQSGVFSVSSGYVSFPTPSVQGSVVATSTAGSIEYVTGEVTVYVVATILRDGEIDISQRFD